MTKRRSILDDEDFAYTLDNEDATSDDDLCASCGETRRDHRDEPGACVFKEQWEETDDG